MIRAVELDRLARERRCEEPYGSPIEPIVERTHIDESSPARRTHRSQEVRALDSIVQNQCGAPWPTAPSVLKYDG